MAIGQGRSSLDGHGSHRQCFARLCRPAWGLQQASLEPAKQAARASRPTGQCQSFTTFPPTREQLRRQVLPSTRVVQVRVAGACRKAAQRIIHSLGLGLLRQQEEAEGWQGAWLASHGDMGGGSVS